MYNEKVKGQRSFAPLTPEYSQASRKSASFSIGSAIILISIVIAILLGFFATTF